MHVTMQMQEKLTVTQNINLCGARLAGLDLRHLDLSGSRLDHADLRGCDLRGCCLERYHLH